MSTSKNVPLRGIADTTKRVSGPPAEPDALAFVDGHPSAKSMAEFQGLLLRLEQDEIANGEHDGELSSSTKAETPFPVR